MPNTGVEGITYTRRDGRGRRATVTVMVRGIGDRFRTLLREHDPNASPPRTAIPAQMRNDIRRDFFDGCRQETPELTGRTRRSVGARIIGGMVEVRWRTPYAAYPDRRGRSRGYVRRAIRNGTRRAERSIRHGVRYHLGETQRARRPRRASA